MLELDLLLNRFLDSGYTDLGVAERADFNRLLAYQDQVLHDWFMGHAVPADAAIRDLVAAYPPRPCWPDGTPSFPGSQWECIPTSEHGDEGQANWLSQSATVRLSAARS